MAGTTLIQRLNRCRACGFHMTFVLGKDKFPCPRCGGAFVVDAKYHPHDPEAVKLPEVFDRPQVMTVVPPEPVPLPPFSPPAPAPNGHNGSNGNGKHHVVCETCGDTKKIVVARKDAFGAPTRSRKKKCPDCG